jgi:hypothetical protein
MKRNPPPAFESFDFFGFQHRFWFCKISLLVGLVVPLKWYSGYICNGVMFSKVVGENLLQFRDVIWIATGTWEEVMFLVDFLCWLETEKFGCRALDTCKCEDCKAPRSSGVSFCRTKLLESSRFSTSDQWVSSCLSSLILLMMCTQCAQYLVCWVWMISCFVTEYNSYNNIFPSVMLQFMLSWMCKS